MKAQREEWLRKLAAGTLPKTRVVVDVCNRIAAGRRKRKAAERAGASRDGIAVQTGRSRLRPRILDGAGKQAGDRDHEATKER